MSALGNHILPMAVTHKGCTCKTHCGNAEWKPHDVVSIIYSLHDTKIETTPAADGILDKKYQLKKIQQKIFSYFMKEEGISFETPLLFETKIIDTLYSVSTIKGEEVKSKATPGLMQILSKMKVGELYPALGKAESWESESDLPTVSWRRS